MRTSCIQAFLCFICLAAISSCSPTLSVITKTKKVFDDSSALIHVSTVLGSDIVIDYGENRVREFRIGFGYDASTELEYRLWMPVNFPSSCLNKLVILTPGFKSSSAFMIPLAVEIVKQGMPVLMFSMRGDDLNSKLPRGYGIHEIMDLPMALWAYQEYFHIKDSLHIALLGSSLGGSLSLHALQEAKNNEFLQKNLNPFVIHSLLLESYVPNLESAAKQMLTANEYGDLQKEMAEHKLMFAQIITDSLIHGISKKTKVLLQWGEHDKLVLFEDRQKAIQQFLGKFPSLKTVTIKGGTHALRVGYPMPAEDVISNNTKMATFLTERMMCK